MNDGGNPNPINPTPEGVVNNAANPLDKLEGVVAAAQQEAAAAKETPKTQFENQFGSGPAAPPVGETPSSSVAQLDPSINTVDDLLAKGPQVVENPNPTVESVVPVEKTPADKLRQKISDDIDAFLEEVLQKEGVTS